MSVNGSLPGVLALKRESFVRNKHYIERKKNEMCHAFGMFYMLTNEQITKKT